MLFLYQILSLIVNIHLEFQEKKVLLTKEEKEAEKTRILGLLERVRGLSDLQFELEKEKRAEEYTPENKIDTLRKEIGQRKPYITRPIVSKVGEYFLSDCIIPILEERLGNNIRAAR